MVKLKLAEDNANIVISYSDEGKMIKPVYDRLGKPIKDDALYAEACDIIVDGMPRYDYIETDIEVDKEEQVYEVGNQ